MKKAIDLTKLEQKYSDSLNAKPETVEQFLKNRKTNLSWNKIFFELLGDFLVFYFASRAIGLVVAPLIIIAVLAVGSLVVKTVSNEVSKSANA